MRAPRAWRLPALLILFAVAISATACGCGGGSGGGGVPAATYRLHVSVEGLSGSGLVLSGAVAGTPTGDVAASGNGAVAALERSGLAPGTPYSVAVTAQPSNPSQTCSVSPVAGVIGNEDAVVAIRCVTDAFTVSGEVRGLTGSGLALAAAGAEITIPPGATAFQFPALLSGTAYEVAVVRQPSAPEQVCSVANGTGVVTSSDVDGVVVSCSTPPPPVRVKGTVSGLAAGETVTLRLNGEESLQVASDAPFTFSTALTPGASYAVTVAVHPNRGACAVAGGSGTAMADVTDVVVTCTGGVVLQRWRAPATWGARWPRKGTMVQHAWFDGATLVEELQTAPRWTLRNGVAPPQSALSADPGGTRWGAGPFDGQFYEASGATDAPIAALTGDILVCAVVKPYYDEPDQFERGIIARGHTNDLPLSDLPNGGWVLHQMHDQFCFHYEYSKAGCSTVAPFDSCQEMVYTATQFPYDVKVAPVRGPLNPSYVVFCGGRDRAAGRIRVAVNSLATLTERNVPSDAVLDASDFATVIGGYWTGEAKHAYRGRIYETAIWSEPASAANIAEKLAAVQGLAADTRYERNREAWFRGVDGQWHARWRHGPRLDANRGMLFGLQSWNRVTTATPTGREFHPYDAETAGEDLALPSWTASQGAAASRDAAVPPPGPSGHVTAPRVTLPAGSSLSAPLGEFDAPGTILGMAWLRPVSAAGTIAIRTNQSQVQLALADYPRDTWTPVWLRGLTTDAAALTAGPVSIVASAANADAVQFYLWGLDLTQIGAGGELGEFEPGPFMYDWNASRDLRTGTGADVRFAQDVLHLPAAPSVPGTGFCLAVTARPFDGASPPVGALSWTAPMRHSRTALAWVSDAPGVTPPPSVRLYVSGTEEGPAGRLCLSAPGSAPLCGVLPATWTAGSEHRLAGCVSATGAMRVFADDARIASRSGAAAAPALSAGHLLVGNAVPDALWGVAPGGAPADVSRAWHGYVSGAAVCTDLADGVMAACR